MARTYIVKRGDTLRKIAKAGLGDAGLYLRIAEFNGMRDPNRLAVGQRLKSFGFTRGGRWSGRGKDPMHFQFCSGY